MFTGTNSSHVGDTTQPFQYLTNITPNFKFYLGSEGLVAYLDQGVEILIFHVFNGKKLKRGETATNLQQNLAKKFLKFAPKRWLKDIGTKENYTG